MSASALQYEGRATKCYLRPIVHPQQKRQTQNSNTVPSIFSTSKTVVLPDATRGFAAIDTAVYDRSPWASEKSFWFWSFSFQRRSHKPHPQENWKRSIRMYT